MKIKKKLLATVLFGCVLSGSAFADKVTYDKAVADSKAYQDSLPHYENERSGLGPDETGGTSASANQMGKWVKLGSSIQFYQTGQYSSLLSQNAEGQPCIKGDKGFIISVTEVGGYQSHVLVSERGFKADCR
ncbi:hypothetical protein [Aliivibrio wodanis]|uniref:hypothetical protein n=1 Tax=Aliivibrio wodanis TaxID=80852 RepID=UPI00406C26A0